jgi:hypothetical protein
MTTPIEIATAAGPGSKASQVDAIKYLESKEENE